MEYLAAQKSVVTLATTSDDNAIPETHFQLLLFNSPEHWICCRAISLIENGTMFDSLPLIFDITARVVRDDCYLTLQGDVVLCDKGESPILSCWVESCPDDVSQNEWTRMIRRLMIILDTTVTPVDTSELLRHRNTQLQIAWSKTNEDGVRIHLTP
jgi:hypothetical protein